MTISAINFNPPAKPLQPGDRVTYAHRPAHRAPIVGTVTAHDGALITVTWDSGATSRTSPERLTRA